MLKSSFTKSIFLTLVTASFYACSKSDDKAAVVAPVDPTPSDIGSGENSAPFKSLAKLPPASGAIVSSAALKLFAATDGLPLAPVGEDEMFGTEYEKFVGEDNLSDYIPASTGSYAACETLNYSRGIIGMIGNVDMSSCFIGKSVGEDLTDTDFHIYEFSMGEMEMKIKIRKVTNDEGFLKGVEMMSCSAGTQTEYTKWDFSGEEISILSKGTSATDNPDVESVSYEYTVTATGVNEDGVLTGEKEIDFRYQNLFTDGGNNHVISTAKQTADKIEFMRAACEKESLTAECATNSESLYVSADIINNNPEGSQSPNLLALGDGAAYIKSADLEGVQQWLADSGLVDNESESTHGTYVQEQSAEIEEISSEHEAVEFAESETWDCSGDATAAEFAEALLPICGAYSLDQNVHLECNAAGLSKDVIAE